MEFDNPNKILIDIFIKDDNLYFSSIDKMQSQNTYVKILYCDKKKSKQCLDKVFKCKLSDTSWFENYKLYLNDKRFIEQYRIIIDFDSKS